MTRQIRSLAVTLLTLPWLSLALPAAACDGLRVDQGYLTEPIPGPGTSAGYGRLSNDGDETLRIDAVSSPQFDHGMLHDTLRDGDRVSMQPMAELNILPGESVALEPGGTHVMLMRTRKPLKAGDQAALSFMCGDKAVTVTMPVRARSGHRHHHD